MYKALKSFSGKISMSKGQVKEIHDEAIVRDLLKVGYIEEVKATAESIKPKPEPVKVEPIVEAEVVTDVETVEEKPKRKKSSSKRKKASE